MFSEGLGRSQRGLFGARLVGPAALSLIMFGQTRAAPVGRATSALSPKERQLAFDTLETEPLLLLVNADNNTPAPRAVDAEEEVAATNLRVSPERKSIADGRTTKGHATLFAAP